MTVFSNKVKCWQTLGDEATNVADDNLWFVSFVGIHMTAALDYVIDLSVTRVCWLW